MYAFYFLFRPHILKLKSSDGDILPVVTCDSNRDEEMGEEEALIDR